MQSDQVLSIGHFLAERRKLIGLSQRDMADALTKRGYDYVQVTIGAWERGRFMPPIDDPKFVRTLAEILEVSEEEILQAAGFNIEIDPSSDDLPDWFKQAYMEASPKKRKMINRLFRSILEEDDEDDTAQ